MAELELPPVRLLYDRILTTTNTRKKTSSGILLSSKEEGLVLEKQTVVAAGPNAIVKVGDEVEIDFFRFPNKLKEKAKNDIGPDIYQTTFPIEIIDGQKYLYISTRELKWIYTKDIEETIE